MVSSVKLAILPRALAALHIFYTRFARMSRIKQYPRDLHAKPRLNNRQNRGAALCAAALVEMTSNKECGARPKGRAPLHGSPSLWGAVGNLLPTEGAFFLFSTSPTTRSCVWPPLHAKERQQCGNKYLKRSPGDFSAPFAYAHFGRNDTLSPRELTRDL